MKCELFWKFRGYELWNYGTLAKSGQEVAKVLAYGGVDITQHWLVELECLNFELDTSFRSD